MERQITDIDQVIMQHSDVLSNSLREQMLRLFAPVETKQLRKFQISEVANFLGVTTGYLRNLAFDGKGPEPETTSGGRRIYSIEQIEELRKYLDENRKGKHRYIRHRVEGEHLQVITVVNFKGGSGKTTTSANLIHGLSLNGLRVLSIDLDAQASLSSMFGVQPEYDVSENETIYGAIRYDEHRRSLTEIIRKTNFPSVDIVPGNIELMEFEYETPRVLSGNATGDGSIFFSRIDEALAEVADDYDVVVIDCPPQLGYLTMTALVAATGILITIHPQMLDVLSMAQFLQMMGDVLDTLKEAGGDMEVDWLRYLVTRYDPQDGAQGIVVNFLRNLFGPLVLDNVCLKSVAISDASLTNQTIYEVDKSSMIGTTYNRAMESVSNVNAEIIKTINDAWGRDR